MIKLGGARVFHTGVGSTDPGGKMWFLSSGPGKASVSLAEGAVEGDESREITGKLDPKESCEGLSKDSEMLSH